MNYLGVEDRPGAAAYVPRWRHNAADSGGGVLTDMLHIVYLAHWIMGGPPTSVSAFVDRRLDADGDVEDIALVRYTYPTGHAFVNMAWGKGPGGVEIGGTKGRIVMETEDDGTHPFVPGRRACAWLGSRACAPGSRACRQPTAWSRILNDFREAVEQGREPIASGEAGLRVLDSVLGAYVAGATGEEVALPLPAVAPDLHERLDRHCGSGAARSILRPATRGLFGLSRPA